MATKEFFNKYYFLSPVASGVGADLVQQCSVPRKTIKKLELKIKV
jgi:hypothetical protein